MTTIGAEFSRVISKCNRGPNVLAHSIVWEIQVSELKNGSLRRLTIRYIR